MTTTQAPGTVAVGYDGTTHSDVALAWAVRHAAALAVPLLLVHACGVPSGYVGYGGATLITTRHELRVTGRRVLDQGLALARAPVETNPERERNRYRRRAPPCWACASDQRRDRTTLPRVSGSCVRPR